MFATPGPARCSSRGGVTCPRLSSACPQTVPLSPHGAPPPMSHDFSQHPVFPDDFITDAYRYVPPADDLSDVDSRFVFEFQTYDELEDGQRWSTWRSVEPLSRGPEPRPG